MQLGFERGKSVVGTTVSGLAWVFGLLLAGSDGNFMPWTNIAGILLFGAAGWYMAAREAGRSTRKNRFRCHGLKGGSVGVPGGRPSHGSCLLGHSS